jgi:OmpA-like transmembrane domain
MAKVIDMRTAAIIAFMAAAGSFAGTAGAAEFGIYAGLSYAQGERDADEAEFARATRFVYEQNDFTPLASTSSFDTEDSGYGFVVGYRLLKNLAFEGGYLDLGDVSHRDRSDGLFDGTTPQSWSQNLDSRTSGIALSALGILPLGYRAEIYARGGILLASNRADIFISNGIRGAPFRVTNSGVDMLAGIGATLTFAEIYGVRLEFQRVFDAGDDETLGEADADLLTIGVTVSF